MRFLDLKTDIFLSANALDALLTYLALQEGEKVTELNGIMQAFMDAVGVGPALLLKVVLCLAVIWVLRLIGRENLLVPLAIIIVAVALSNLLVIRLQGIPL